MATHHTPNFLFPCCGWFWCEMHRQSRRRLPYCRTGTKLWNIRRLDRGVKLWHHTKVKLRQRHTKMIFRYIHARLHHKKIAKIPTWDIKTPTILYISLSLKEIRISSPGTNQHRWLQARWPQRNQPRSENSCQYSLICRIRWSHNSNGTINIGEWTI